eukprot:15181934-Alexandrium_andersonii.AAC.1
MFPGIGLLGPCQPRNWPLLLAMMQVGGMPIPWLRAADAWGVAPSEAPNALRARSVCHPTACQKAASSVQPESEASM